MKIVKNDILFVLAIILAVWFLALGWVWTYWFALVFAYPAGIISVLIWFALKKDKRKRNKAIPVLLAIGTIISLTAILLIR